MNVSIIVPIYNVSNFIERCVNSVIAQTFTGSLECILVDDVSPDDSIAKCEKILETYKGPIEFSIIHHEVNKGLSGARNTGTRAARGDYLYYFDSDDELTPNCIELLYEQVRSHENVQMVVGQTKAVPHKPFYEIEAFKQLQYIEGNDLIRFLSYKPGVIIPVNAWNKLVRRDFIEQNQLYFKEGIIHEDHHWSYFVAKHLNSIAFVFVDCYIHYSTPNSIMTSLNLNKSYEHHGLIMLDTVENFDKNCLDLQIYRYVVEYLLRYKKMQQSITYKKLNGLLVQQTWKHKYRFVAVLCLLCGVFRFTPKGFPFGWLLRKYCGFRTKLALRKHMNCLQIKYDKKINIFSKKDY